MSIKYSLNIENPGQHYVGVTAAFPLDSEGKALVFMPSWSPGSYLLREYARLVRKLEVLDSSGSSVELIQSSKGSWNIFAGADMANQDVAMIVDEKSSDSAEMMNSWKDYFEDITNCKVRLASSLGKDYHQFNFEEDNFKYLLNELS